MRKVIALMALVLGLAPVAMADTITLTGTVRDFYGITTPAGALTPHPDFEGVISGLVTGMVAPTLPGSGVPVYVGVGGGGIASGGVQSAASFAQWYTNVGGTNIAAPLSITLDNGQVAPGGIYTYSNAAFFPIDNQLGLNEGLPHNYHFTYALSTDFKWMPGGIFNYQGDDDLWVFMNDKLVMDLGGVHLPAAGNVTLTPALATFLSLSPGQIAGTQTIPFDLFFAERHTSQSNFTIETSILGPTQIVPEPGSMALLGVGVIAAGLGARKRRRR